MITVHLATDAYNGSITWCGDPARLVTAYYVGENPKLTRGLQEWCPGCLNVYRDKLGRDYPTHYLEPVPSTEPVCS